MSQMPSFLTPVQYREQVEWLGGHFYAEGFNPKDVIFDKYDK